MENQTIIVIVAVISLLIGLFFKSKGIGEKVENRLTKIETQLEFIIKKIQ